MTFVLMLVSGLIGSSRMRRGADRRGGRVPRDADSTPVALALQLTGLVYYGALLLWAAYPPLLGGTALSIPPLPRWLGAALAGAGIALALWSLHHLGRNVTPTAAARPDVELVDSGPYRRVRHPLYSSMLLTIPGFGLLSANLLVFVAGAANLGILAFRTRREERELLARLGGEYAAYRERTGRFLPRSRPS